MQEHVTPVVKQQDKLIDDSRRGRRKMFARISPKPRYRRTGTTPHFALWMADLKLKSTLQKMRVSKLADDPSTEPKAAIAYARIERTVRSVYALTQATREELLEIDGIGPARLKAIHDDLLKHGVQTRWTA